MTAAWTRPVDGAGTWQHTRSHGLRLMFLGTLIATLLLAVLFLTAVAVGRQAMCATHQRDGHPALTYCPGYVGQVQR